MNNTNHASQNAFWTRIIYVLSVTISLVVAFLILGPRPDGIEGSIDVSMLPMVNAILNGLNTLLLLFGFYLIKSGRINHHKTIMLSSFGVSTLFLISYVIYHWFKSGPKLYIGEYQTFYYFILLSHILLAAIIIPLALFTLYRGWTLQIREHKKIARITFPTWLYVSITGVIIYVMLY